MGNRVNRVNRVNKGNWGNKENKGKISVQAKISSLLLIVYRKNYLNAAVHATRK